MDYVFTDRVFLSLIGVSFLVILVRVVYGIYRLFQEKRKSEKSLLRKVIYGALLPMNFVAIFLQKRRERELPFYFRWFLALTKTCSKIPLFHFIPKFFVAVTSEHLVRFFTHSDLLTGVVFLWSISFFIIITIVEGQIGEFHEEAITTANKFFLFSVSWVTLCIIFAGVFLSEAVQPYIDNVFWHFIANVALTFNDYLRIGWSFFWNMNVIFIILFFVILFIYIGTSLSLSHYLRKKKEN